jgi:hypothetical protein
LNKYGINELSFEQQNTSISPNISFTQSQDLATIKDRPKHNNLLSSSHTTTQNKFDPQNATNPYLANHINNHFDTRREVSPQGFRSSSEKKTLPTGGIDPKTTAFEGTPSKMIGETQRSNKENFAGNLTPGARLKGDSGAIAGAMKAL